MCSLYEMMAGPQAVRCLTRASDDRTHELPKLAGISPDYTAPIVRNNAVGRELIMGRWGMPSPSFGLMDKRTDPGFTNIRNTSSDHWRRWLEVENRCVVPFTSFSEIRRQPDATWSPIWFALNETEPLACFAGIWTRWTSIRKVRDGETTDDLFGILTAAPNALVSSYHPKSMPVILRTAEEIDVWLTAPTPHALALQRPIPDDALVIIHGGRNERV